MGAGRVPRAWAGRCWTAAALVVLAGSAAACFGLMHRRAQLPTEGYLAEARARVDEWVILAEDVGVRSASDERRDRAGAGALSAAFRFYARLARDFPADGGRVGNFLADVLLPGLLRVIDATRRDIGTEAAGLLEPIVGEIFINTFAMEKRAAEVEKRLIEGEVGFSFLYWARDFEAGLPDEMMKVSIARYESILERCHAREGGCDPAVTSRVTKSIEELRSYLNGAPRPS